MNILMVAAENDALPNGKVGGMGDVVRDVPAALVKKGHKVNVLMPAYGYLAEDPQAQLQGTVSVEFCSQQLQLNVFTVPAKKTVAGVTHWVVDHPWFAVGGKGNIYADDPPGRPFATDASKFGLFTVAVAQMINDGFFKRLNVLHLHDWHTAMLAVLLKYHPDYKKQSSLKLVYTIHNLALQGVRPFGGDDSSLEAWFPDIEFEYDVLRDPRYHDCINLMRAGIVLCDKVHAVSPTYVDEIVQANDKERGFFGGCGLEQDLKDAKTEKRLVGILNGADYSEAETPAITKTALIKLCEQTLISWAGKSAVLDSAHFIASQRLLQWQKQRRKEEILITSVGRITEQKVLLLKQPLDNGLSALECLLNRLGQKGKLLLLGSGDSDFEQFLLGVASRCDNLIFLKGYSETLSKSLYASGDLFLMPSSFEPCGISQMLAMRAGQACLVHGVGGLADTVIDNTNGFSFRGNSLKEQAENMLKRFDEALVLNVSDTEQWASIRSNAKKARFLWSATAKQYVEQLYQ